MIHNLNQTLTVYLSAEVDKHHQQITWNPATTNLKTTDNVTFDATTTGSAAGLSVRYSVTEGADVASVNAATGALTIIKDGSVTIQADADGNETTHYAAEPVSKTFTISKVKPTITSAPTAATMTLPNTSLADCNLTDGLASVEGSFDWGNKSINATYNNSGYKVVFTPSNANWYDTASCVVVVPVDKIAQEITWNFNVTEMFCNATYAFTGANAATVNNNVGNVVYETSADTIAYVDDAKNLKIVKGGSVTITARCAGNDLYAAAAPVEKTFTIHRMAPTIEQMPMASSMKIGRLLSDASLTGGRAELKGAHVEGAFVWVDGNTTVMDSAGTFEKQVVFAPANKNYYDSVSTTMNVTVEKYAPVLSNNTLVGTTLSYGQVLNTSTINGSITATDTVKLPHVAVAGKVAWKNASITYPTAGDPTFATAVFVPENTDWYNEVEIANVPLTVNAVAAASYSATATIVYGQRLSEAELTNTTTGVFGEPVNGSVAWAEGVNLDTVLAIGDHDVAIRFTSSSSNYTDGEGWCVVTVEEGVVFKGQDNTDSSWGDVDNWQGKNMPGTNDRVTVDADVEISGNVNVIIGGLTINEGKTVVVKDSAVLTIGNLSSFERENGYGNLYVENGGKVILSSGEVKVNDFILEAKLGDNTESNPTSSGQVDGDEQLTVNGDAYFKISFDPRGAIDYGWYDFTVPFEVDVRNGVYDEDGNKLTYNVDYAVMDFSEAKRAANTKYWNWFTGTLQPGQLYSITLEETKTWNTFLFKRKANTTQYGSNTYGASYTESGETNGRGWNGMGNGTLRHCQLNNLPAQTKILVYDHANDRYVEREADEYTYAVGTAFFVQVDAAKDIDLTAVEDNRAFLAPMREQSQTEEFRLSLREEGNHNPADQMWVSASEEATGEYVIGHDLLKMGTPTQAKVAQMWCNNNGLQLCDIEMPLINEEANCTIGLFAPKTGAYTLEIARAPKDGALYLTYNDNIIWDLTMSAYELVLSKGTTDGYGLRLVNKRAPQVTTGTDEINGGEMRVRKVIIDNIIYMVTPEGAIYDINGKKVQ